MEKDWYKQKQYPHIGLPLTGNDRQWVAKYVSDPEKVATHAFLPFIHREIKQRKFRKYDLPDGSRSRTRINNKPKTRPIHYASHLDSNIYSFYANTLQYLYEEQIKEREINDCVTAYRKIPINPLKPCGKKKCNIDFANDVFKYISKETKSEMVAIVFDIKGFFKNIDHKKIKHSWQRLLTRFNLPDDHYNVFRNITKFSYIDEIDIFENFKNQIITQNHSKNPKIHNNKKRKRVTRLKYLHNQNAIAFCTKKDYLKWDNRHQYIKNNKYLNQETKELRKKGIPQGATISAILANLYMLEFDTTINKKVTEIGGIYRRYSDDMVVVCPSDYEEQVKSWMRKAISEEKLEIQEEKTQVFLFQNKDNKITCYHKRGEYLDTNNRFEYLGFEFDGENAYLKSASLSKFYRRMKRSVKKGKHHALRFGNTTTFGELFKNRLYKKFSYLGSHRRRKRVRDPKDKSNFIHTKKQDWGNYLSYAKKAHATMEPHSKIKQQIRRHWRILHKLMQN
ncbi:reverse transcriptase (RNA-dependent DNA polymerase) [Marinilabilia salmonicolor]|jgi:hypothetical protein|uniref:reverse transcriptase domain-containing protein n=1 Tax=Marinilabilia salmonicolor TaxID=989 RepID=UPI000D048C7A|nr:reverse transcriptase domain-containing protein [Marinilabilia salmonicolor]PRZ00809.1 reverse transcriptase (RNA-dependent DNA polymerase) [Marinilabilia salmonicolor]